MTININDYSSLKDVVVQVDETNLMYYYDIPILYYQVVDNEYFMFCYNDIDEDGNLKYAVSKTTKEIIDSVASNKTYVRKPFDDDYVIVFIDFDDKIVEIKESSPVDVLPFKNVYLRP